jgi:hypothetical protein
MIIPHTRKVRSSRIPTKNPSPDSGIALVGLIVQVQYQSHSRESRKRLAAQMADPQHALVDSSPSADLASMAQHETWGAFIANPADEHKLNVAWDAFVANPAAVICTRLVNVESLIAHSAPKKSWNMSSHFQCSIRRRKMVGVMLLIANRFV